MHKSLRVFGILTALGWLQAQANPLVYEGTSGPGQGKHIVLLAGDHEYRSEETVPALARILARHHGFKCTVLFTLDPESGEILPGSSFLTGAEALKSADGMLVSLRFQDFPSEQMQHIVDYLDRGGPVMGLRTSTHAFNIPAESEFAKYSFQYPGEEYTNGFGRQVLGETWAGHYGENHRQSTRIVPTADMADHPILRGVENVWVQAGGYFADPKEGSRVLAMAQPLNGMTPDAPPDESRKPVPGAWTRLYENASGTPGRVFTSTYGASEDILNEGYRRMLVNACFWAVGLEDEIQPDLDIAFVGPYNPVTFRFDGYRRGVKPADLAGWDSPIMSTDKPVGEE